MENLGQYLWIVMGLVSGLGLLGNTLVFIVLRLEPNKLAVLYWLMCLAIVDFGSLVFWPMTAVSWRCVLPNPTNCSNTQSTLYGTSHLIQSTMLTVAGYVVLGAAIDRYIAIAKPTSSRLLATKTNVLVSITVIAIVAVVVNGLCWLIHDETRVSHDNTNMTSTQSTASQHQIFFPHILGVILTQALPLVLVIVFFFLLLVVFTRAKRQLSRQRYTRRRYLANIANTAVVLGVQATFIMCGGFTIAHNMLVTFTDTWDSLVVTSIILTCVRVSAMFFIFLALDAKFRIDTRQFLLCQGMCNAQTSEPATHEI